jgi:hypothetical protein
VVAFGVALAACGDSSKPGNPDGGDVCQMPTTVNEQLLNAPLDPAVFVVKKNPMLPDLGIPQ